MNPNPPQQDYTVSEVPRLLLTYQQAGDALGVSDKTIRALVIEKALPVVRITPQNPRIDPRDILAWIDRVKENPIQ